MLFFFCLDMERYKFLQQAMSTGLQVPLKFLKFVFLGPPGAGKSTFMRRLIGEKVKIGIQPSTLTADQKELIIKVCLDKENPHDSRTLVINTCLLAKTNSKWCAVSEEEGELNLDEEALMIYRFINESNQQQNQISTDSLSQSNRQSPEILSNTTGPLLKKHEVSFKTDLDSISLSNDPIQPQNLIYDQAIISEPIEANGRDVPLQFQVDNPTKIESIEANKRSFLSQIDQTKSNEANEENILSQIYHVDDHTKTESVEMYESSVSPQIYDQTSTSEPIEASERTLSQIYQSDDQPTVVREQTIIHELTQALPSDSSFFDKYKAVFDGFKALLAQKNMTKLPKFYLKVCWLM